MGTVVNLLEQIQHLRYDVYCLERHFEHQARFPDGRERDEYDDSAVHLAAHDERGVVATVRLVLDSPVGFPLEAYVDTLYREFADLPRDRTAEISRLIVAKSHRHLHPDGVDYPVLFGLFREIYQTSVSLGIEHLVAVMERRLWRLARGFGFHFRAIGDPVEHRGERIPYAAPVRALWAGHERALALQGFQADTRPYPYEYEKVSAAA